MVGYDVTRYLSSIGYLYLGSSCLSSSVLGLTAPFLFFPRPFTPSSVSRRDGGVRRDVTEENGPASDTVPRDGGRPACLVSRRSSPGSFPRLSFTPVHFSSPGGLVPRAGKKGECWTFLDWRLNSENDSPVHGQPSFDSLLPFRSPSGSPPPTTHTRDPANRTSWERNGKGINYIILSYLILFLSLSHSRLSYSRYPSRSVA